MYFTRSTIFMSIPAISAGSCQNFCWWATSMQMRFVAPVEVFAFADTQARKLKKSPENVIGLMGAASAGAAGRASEMWQDGPPRCGLDIRRYRPTRRDSLSAL